MIKYMMKELNSEKKADILIAALEERYRSLHAIRERVQSVGIWYLGIMLGVAGWLLQSDILLSCLQKRVYILAIIISFIAIRFFYLENLCSGFKSQQRTAVKIEKALGFFVPGFFDGSDKSLYPESWEKAGAEDGEGKFFKTSYLLIYIGTGFLIATILINGCFIHYSFLIN
jgi:hypothetical protein